MSLGILIENGPWMLVQDVSRLAVKDAPQIERSIKRINNNLKRSLGLRQEPIELRYNLGELEIRARGIAGTLSAEGLVVDIAPKFALKADEGGEWNLSLLMLVRHAQPRNVVFSRSSHLNIANVSFLDLLAMAFVDAIESACNDQLIHTYQVKEISSPTVKGRLNIQRQILASIQRPHLIECDVDQLDTNNPYNDLLCWAIKYFYRLVESPRLRQQINELSTRIPGRPNPLLAQRHSEIKPPPQYRNWESALKICSILYKGLNLSSQTGQHSGYSFLFNMEKLFEHFVENLLTRSIRKITERTLVNERQYSSLYAKPEGNNNPFFSKPDNVLLEGDNSVLVVDAKYKRLSDNLGDRDRKPQSQDVYELVAAMTAHRCNKSLLLYPKVVGNESLTDGHLAVWNIDAFGTELKVGAIAIDLMELRNRGGLEKLEQSLAVTIVQLLE
jgi:5-methylcytosine-specific restriction enzyme subunit McrC